MTRRIIPHAPGATFASTVLAVGEIVYDETTGQIVTGDGATAGGNPVGGAGGGSGSIFPPGTVAVFEGDSLTAMPGTSPNVSSYPTELLALSALDGMTGYNVATSGNTLAQIASQYVSEVYPRRPVGGIPASLLFVWIGANDQDDLGSPSTYLASLESYWAAAKADGFTVIAFTIINRTDVAMTVEQQNNFRKIVNAGIRASDTYDYLIDVDQMFPNTDDPATFVAGGIHLNDTGNAKLARYINAVLTAGGAIPAIATAAVDLVKNRPAPLETYVYMDGAAGASMASPGADLQVGTGDWTIAARVSLPVRPVAATHDLFGGGTGALGVFFSDRGQVGFLKVNTTTFTRSSTCIPLHRPTDVVLLRRSGTVYCYLDGQLDFSVANVIDFNAQTLELGSRASNAAGTRFKGYMSTPQLWKRAWTEDEIAEFSASGQVADRTSLGFLGNTRIAFSGGALPDLSGASHNITAPGGWRSAFA